jgi:alkyl hydroperoxide reductase subunit D
MRKERSMSLKEFADTLPDYAKDIRLNLSILSDQTLGDQRKYGLLLACAHGTGYRPIVAAAEAEARQAQPRGGQCGARRAAVMAMNNVYYRFVHLASNPEYGRCRRAADERHRPATASTRTISSCSASRSAR